MLVRTTKHVDIDYGALSAHLFRCMFIRLSLSLIGPYLSVAVSGFCGTSFVLFLPCVCYAFVRVCLLMPFGHLLGKG